MKRSKFSDEQILAIVKEGEAGLPQGTNPQGCWIFARTVWCVIETL